MSCFFPRPTPCFVFGLILSFPVLFRCPSWCQSSMIVTPVFLSTSNPLTNAWLVRVPSRNSLGCSQLHHGRLRRPLEAHVVPTPVRAVEAAAHTARRVYSVSQHRVCPNLRRRKRILAVLEQVASRGKPLRPVVQRQCLPGIHPCCRQIPRTEELCGRSGEGRKRRAL